MAIWGLRDECAPLVVALPMHDVVGVAAEEVQVELAHRRAGLGSRGRRPLLLVVGPSRRSREVGSGSLGVDRDRRAGLVANPLELALVEGKLVHETLVLGDEVRVLLL